MSFAYVTALSILFFVAALCTYGIALIWKHRQEVNDAD